MLLGVSVLTSMDDDDLDAVGVSDPVAAQVMRLAELAQDAGLDGLICSPKEILPLKERFRQRSQIGRAWHSAKRAVSSADQKRTLTPADAILAGADHLVIGRPITEADDPRAAAEAINAEIDLARKAA